MRSEEFVVNIIFDAGKGATPPQSREGTVGSPLGALPVPVRSGYRFAGWYDGAEQVTQDTVIAGNGDLRLVARWEKIGGKERKNTVMWKQKVFAAVLAVAIVFLAAAVLIANRIVLVYYLTDKYVDEATGETRSDRYTIKKQDGVYKLFDRSGKVMETTENGYDSKSENVRYEVYVAEKSGNQYLLNTSTGAYEVYAVVDYDPGQGETLGGTVKNKRVMMFPRVGQENTYSIEVKNQYGTFTFYRENYETGSTVKDQYGNVKKSYSTAVKVKKGNSDILAAYDPTLFASLCVSCGYTLTMQKLDFTDAETPRRADGSVDMNAYGLVDRYDAEGNLTYSPAVYTVVRGVKQGDDREKPGHMDPEASYTVIVGDKILSGGGYYVQLQGRDAVYIVSNSIAETVLQPVESLVTPALVYPMTVSTYVMVNDFFLATVADMSKINQEDEEATKNNIQIKVLFDFVDLDKRQDSIYSSSPYWVSKEHAAGLKDGFVLDNDSVSTVLGNLYQMKFVGCKVLNPTDDDLKKYNLYENIYLLRFKYDPDVATGGSEEKNWADNWVFISQKTEDGTYYAYSSMYNMIVEVDQSFFSFLEWSDSHWYNKYFFQQNIAYVRQMTVKYGSRTYDMTMDNTLSYAYYDKDESLGLASGTVMDPTKGELTQLKNGNYRYKDASGKTYTLSSSTVSREYSESGTATGRYIYTKTGTLIDLKTGTLSEEGTVYTVTKTGASYKVYQIDLSKTEVKSYYTNNGTKATSVIYRDARGTEVTVSAGTSNLRVSCNGTRIDYRIEDTQQTDTGKTETETYTALDNFRRLYSWLLWYTIEEDISEKQLGGTVNDYVKLHDPTMEITVSVEDLASVLNRNNYTNNNKQRLVIRIYEHTDQNSLLTVELLTDENATPDATKATKGFYVQTRMMENIGQYIEDFVNGALIPMANP